MIASVPYQAHLGVAVMVWQRGKLLLGKRSASHSGVHTEPCWQFPGGHLEAGETVLDCARREVLEETGLIVKLSQHAGYTNQSTRIADKEYFTLYVSATIELARLKLIEPKVMEPEKCECWQWFVPSQLPSPLFSPITHYLQQYPDLSIFQIEG